MRTAFDDAASPHHRSLGRRRHSAGEGHGASSSPLHAFLQFALTAFVLDELYCFPSLSPLVSLSYLSLSFVCCPGNRYPSQSHASLPIGIFFSGLGPLPLDSAHLHPQTAGPLLCGWGSSCAHARKVSRCEHECLRGPTFGVPRGHSLRNHLEADRWRHGGAGLMLHDPIFMRSRKPGFLHVKSPDC